MDENGYRMTRYMHDLVLERATALGLDSTYAQDVAHAAARMSISESGGWKVDVNPSSGASGPLQMLQIAAEDTVDSYRMFKPDPVLFPAPPDGPNWKAARNQYRGLDERAALKGAVAFSLYARRYGSRMRQAGKRALTAGYDEAGRREIVIACLALGWAGGPSKVTKANSLTLTGNLDTDVAAIFSIRSEDYLPLFKKARALYARVPYVNSSPLKTPLREAAVVKSGSLTTLAPDEAGTQPPGATCPVYKMGY